MMTNVSMSPSPAIRYSPQEKTSLKVRRFASAASVVSHDSPASSDTWISHVPVPAWSRNWDDDAAEGMLAMMPSFEIVIARRFIFVTVTTFTEPDSCWDESGTESSTGPDADAHVAT